MDKIKNPIAGSYHSIPYLFSPLLRRFPFLFPAD